MCLLVRADSMASAFWPCIACTSRIRLGKELIHVVVVHKAVKHGIALLSQLLEGGICSRTSSAAVMATCTLIDLLKSFELLGILL